MKISVDRGHAGYTYCHAWYEVYLDDELLDDCITADDETGEVVRFQCDAAGRIVRNEKTGHAATYVQKGTVRIVDTRR